MVDYPKFIIKFLKAMKHRSLNQYNPMYVKQPYYQMAPGMPPYMQGQVPDMRPPVDMVQPGYMYAQQPVMYPMQMMPGMQAMQNPRISLQAQPIPPAMNFRNAYDVINKKIEFKKLPKPTRQEILKSILVAKLRGNKNPEM